MLNPRMIKGRREKHIMSALMKLMVMVDRGVNQRIRQLNAKLPLN